MSVQSGKFKCPQCGNNKVYYYDEQQNKKDKWILHSVKRGSLYSYYAGGEKRYQSLRWFKTSDDCWNNTGGSTLNEWNEEWNNEWKCNKCVFTTKSFLDFIHNNFNNINI